MSVANESLESAPQMAIEVPITILPKDRPQLRARRRFWRDILEILILVVTIYTVVNLATARAIVEGSSMQPNFKTGQLVIVNRFAYFFGGPSRGDVVVLHNPSAGCKDMIQNRSVISLPFISPDSSNGTCEDLIKRVIGLPGDYLELREGHMYANGVLLNEPYIDEQNFCSGCGPNTWLLKDDEYFVMGDNRRYSWDSHNFGPINRSLVVGQAWVRYWPLEDFQVVPHPRYSPMPKNFIPPTTTPTPIPSATSIAPTPAYPVPSGVPGLKNRNGV